MSKKQQRPKAFTGEGFDADTGLPDPATVQKMIAETTGTTPPATPGKTYTLVNPKDVPAKQPGLTAKGRSKFTTMLRPDLRQKLEAVAQANFISVADILETVIKEYFNLDK